MTPTLLFWFRIVVILLIAYTLYTYVRMALKRGYWIPKTGADYRSLAGDLLSLAGGVFILFLLQKNYQAPMDKVMTGQGKAIPDLVYHDDATGKAMRLSDLRGKTVVLNLWATWCPPCRAEMPALSELQETYAKQGVVVLALSDEDSSTVHQYLQQHPYAFSAGTWDGVHPMMQEVNTRPASILINAQGEVTDMVVGARGFRFFSGWVDKALENKE